MSSVYQKVKKILFSKIENEVIIIPAFGKAASDDKPCLFCLNDPTSIQIWELIDGKKKVSQIIEEISALFGAETDKIKNDIENFLSELKDNGLICKKA